MTLQWVPVTLYNSGDSFAQLKMGYRNGMSSPIREVQHSRLIDTTETSGVNSPTEPTNEGEWIDKIYMSKKEQYQFGEINKINRFGKTG